VEHAHGVRGELVEPLAEALLAEGASAPSGRRLRAVGDRQDEAAELGRFSRIRVSRLAWRRSNSRRAEAPEVPMWIGSGVSTSSTDGMGSTDGVGSTGGGGFEARFARTSTTECAGEQSTQRTVFVDRS
jgi:hypothetical protein